MNFLDKYNEEINYVWNYVLKEKLIQSFVKFYGKDNEYKIRNIIENLVILRAEHNLGEEELKKRITIYRDQLSIQAKNILDTLNIPYSDNDKFISKCEIFTGKDRIFFEELFRDTNNVINLEEVLLLRKYEYMYQYYNSLKNVDFKESVTIIGRNVNTFKYDTLLNLNKYPNEIGVVNMKINGEFLTCIFGYGLDLDTLIHEINHLLSKEILAINVENSECIKQYGFLSMGDFLYEIINEYMTLDILNYMNSKLDNEYDYLLQKKHRSGYLDIDDVCLNVVKKIYNMSGEIISDSLIHGDGSKFVKVIGRDNYDNINKCLVKTYNLIIKKKKKNPKVKREDLKLKSDLKNLLKQLLKRIEKNIVEYNRYNENLESQLVEMEKMGTIKRL